MTRMRVRGWESWRVVAGMAALTLVVVATVFVASSDAARTDTPTGSVYFGGGGTKDAQGVSVSVNFFQLTFIPDSGRASIIVTVEQRGFPSADNTVFYASRRNLRAIGDHCSGGVFNDGTNVVSCQYLGALHVRARLPEDNDNFNASGYAKVVTAFGNGGNDFLFGGLSHDELHGGSGDDYLFGGDSRDQLFGENGQDTLVGGKGSDVLDGGAGVDYANYGGAVSSVNVTLDGAANDGGSDEGDNVKTENVAGGGSGDTLVGDSGPNLLRGNAGDDVLKGGGSADNLQGNVGNDTIYGEDGADMIDGGAGDDRIYSGFGADRIVAGDGSDYIDAKGDVFIDVISCGSGANDTVKVDAVDRYDADCEIIIS